MEMKQADGVASLILHRITADDSGTYIVMAENEFGMDCHYASLAVEGNFFCGQFVMLRYFLFLIEFSIMLSIIVLLHFRAT